MPTKPMLPARERNETASQSWHHPVEWAVRSNAKIAWTNVLSEGHRTVSERHRDVTRERTSLSRVQHSQLRGGGCVWQAPEIGQDGFQDFDRICRHVENTAAFTPECDLRCLRFLLFKSESRQSFLNRRKRRSRRGSPCCLLQLNPSIRGFAFPCNLRAACLRKCFDVLSDFGRHKFVSQLSIHCRVRGWIEWLSSAVHSCPGPHSAHDRARQATLDLSESLSRRDLWADG